MTTTDHTTERSEREPLLSQPAVPTRTNPLPKLQLAAIYSIKLLVPVASTQLLPYVNVMIQELLERSGMEAGKEKVGYYSGLVSTSTYVAQLVSIYPWARMSDRVGRLPVVLLGTTGIAISTTIFGLSQSFAAVLLSRFFGGLFCGTIGAIHSVVGELSDSTNQSTAFPLYDLVSALGYVVGPLIGGTFANPTIENLSWPWHYLPNTVHILFKEFPYLLPCVITSIMALAATAFGFYVLEETLPAKRKSDLSSQVPKVPVPTSYTQPSPSSVATGSAAADASIVDQKPLPLRVLLTIPAIRAISLSSFSLGFVGIGFNVVFVLVAYTDPTHGGLGLSPSQIGWALSIMGIISIFLKLSMTVILRPHRPGALTWLFNLTMRSWIVAFLGFPFLSWIVSMVKGADQGSNSHPQSLAIGGDRLVWAAASFVLFLSRIGAMAFTLILILAREASPNPNSLGTTNGLTEFAQFLGISTSPVIVSSLFAFSLGHPIFGGYLWTFVYILVSIGGAFIAGVVGKHRSLGYQTRGSRNSS